MELTESIGTVCGAPQTAPLSFVLAASRFFGRKPEQSLKEFNDELKALGPADRVEFQKMFADAGWNVLV